MALGATGAGTAATGFAGAAAGVATTGAGFGASTMGVLVQAAKKLAPTNMAANEVKLRI